MQTTRTRLKDARRVVYISAMSPAFKTQSAENLVMTKSADRVEVGLTCTLLIIFVACFAIQAQDALRKCIAGKTTSTNWVEPTPDGLPLPYVTVCPGFKPGTFASVESEEYPHYLVDKFTPAETVATPGQVERWFMERTFELSEAIAEIRVNKMAVPVRLGHNNATNVTVSVRNVTWGRCYTVKSGNSSRGERLDLTLNHSLARSFGLYLSEDSAQLGLYFNNWACPTTGLRISSGDYTDVTLSQLRQGVHSRGETVCRSDITAAEYLDCIRDWARKTYLEANCSKVCRFPQTDSVVGHLNLPQCATRPDLRCMSDHFGHVMGNTLNEEITGCKRSCWQTYQTHETRVVMEMGRLEHASKTGIYFSSGGIDVTVMEEIVLYDLNGLVSAIGGSLGLFLGFSCYEVAKKLVRKTCGWIGRRLA